MRAMEPSLVPAENDPDPSSAWALAVSRFYWFYVVPRHCVLVRVHLSVTVTEPAVFRVLQPRSWRISNNSEGVSWTFLPPHFQRYSTFHGGHSRGQHYTNGCPHVHTFVIPVMLFMWMVWFVSKPTAVRSVPGTLFFVPWANGAFYLQAISGSVFLRVTVHLLCLGTAFQLISKSQEMIPGFTKVVILLYTEGLDSMASFSSWLGWRPVDIMASKDHQGTDALLPNKDDLSFYEA